MITTMKLLYKMEGENSRELYQRLFDIGGIGVGRVDEMDDSEDSPSANKFHSGKYVQGWPL